MRSFVKTNSAPVGAPNLTLVDVTKYVNEKFNLTDEEGWTPRQAGHWLHYLGFYVFKFKKTLYVDGHGTVLNIESSDQLICPGSTNVQITLQTDLMLSSIGLYFGLNICNTLKTWFGPTNRIQNNLSMKMQYTFQLFRVSLTFIAFVQVNSLFYIFLKDKFTNQNQIFKTLKLKNLWDYLR